VKRKGSFPKTVLSATAVLRIQFYGSISFDFANPGEGNSQQPEVWSEEEAATKIEQSPASAESAQSIPHCKVISSLAKSQVPRNLFQLKVFEGNGIQFVLNIVE
jgi:hypothetical protein